VCLDRLRVEIPIMENRLANGLVIYFIVPKIDYKQMVNLMLTEKRIPLILKAMQLSALKFSLTFCYLLKCL